MTTPRSNQAADEEIPKLGSVPPEEEYEVTRVGSRDEIQRALEDQEGERANNLPTPPAPPPTEQMRHVLAGGPVVRLAPPPADLMAANANANAANANNEANNVPTKPPTAGLVSDADIDTAFLDPSLASRLEELDENEAKPTKQTLDVPVFPHVPRFPGSFSGALPGDKAGAGAAKKVSPTAEGPEDEVDESRSRRIRSRAEPATTATEESATGESGAGEDARARDAPLAEASASSATGTGRQVLIVAVTIALLVILAMLRR
jgi:hypothetical protein